MWIKTWHFSVKQDIIFDNYKCCVDRNRGGGGIAFYVKNNSKPITVGTIFSPASQTNFLKLLNNMNKINSVKNATYVISNYAINWFSNNSNILEENNILITKSIPSEVKSYHKLLHFFALINY